MFECGGPPVMLLNTFLLTVRPRSPVWCTRPLTRSSNSSFEASADASRPAILARCTVWRTSSSLQPFR